MHTRSFLLSIAWKNKQTNKRKQETALERIEERLSVEHEKAYYKPREANKKPSVMQTILLRQRFIAV